MVKLKLSRFRRRPRFLMKKKDKNVGGGNNMNNFNGGGDGEQKKEKDPAKVQDRIDITLANKLKIAQYVNAASKHFIEMAQAEAEVKLEKDNNGGGGGDDDNDGGGGGKNNKKGSDRDGDGDGNGDKYKRGFDDSGGYTKGKNMDCMGKAGFGYRYGYHAGNENEYPVEQLQCVQEVQLSDSKCLFYHAITVS